MKKTLSIIVLGIIVLTSCKKEYTCECKTNGGVVPIVIETPIKDTKKKATDSCESGSTTNQGIVTTCTLK
jgi:hypothetical protein